MNSTTSYKMLSPYDVSEITGLTYAKALALVKGMAYIKMDNRYFVSEATLHAFLTQGTATELITTND